MAAVFLLLCMPCEAFWTPTNVQSQTHLAVHNRNALKMRDQSIRDPFRHVAMNHVMFAFLLDTDKSGFKTSITIQTIKRQWHHTQNNLWSERSRISMQECRRKTSRWSFMSIQLRCDTSGRHSCTRGAFLSRNLQHFNENHLRTRAIHEMRRMRDSAAKMLWWRFRSNEDDYSEYDVGYCDIYILLPGF